MFIVPVQVYKEIWHLALSSDVKVPILAYGCELVVCAWH